MIPMIIDNISLIIPMLAVGIVLWMWTCEMYKTTVNNTGGAISETHLDKHTNILIQALVGLGLFAWGVYGISLTPIDYMVVDAQDAFYLASDGLYHINHANVMKDDTTTLLNAFGGKYAIGISLGMLTFFHSAISHLKDEREDRFIEDADYVDSQHYWKKKKDSNV